MLKYWLWLSHLGAMPGDRSFQLLEHFGTPEAAYFADEREYDLIRGVTPALKQSLKQKSLVQAERILEDCDRLGIRILTIQDTEYPERLRQISDPPCVLYVKGRLPHLDEEVAVSIVGARKSTPYGELAASRLALGLARQGALLVTGTARGIDSAGIRGALKGGGRVVSVLGNGIDVIYPRGHEELYADVASVGALLSEYPPGTEPDGVHFPIRNRIISGLSLGVVVAEAAAERSGALITARLALEQNRDVFAVPGSIDAPMSAGPNRLIQRGEAKLVMTADDILEEYRFLYPQKLTPARQPTPELERERVGTAHSPRVPEKPTEQPPCREESGEGRVLDLKAEPELVTEDERAILRALEGTVLTADALIEQTGLPARRIFSALTMLQLRHLVAEEAGKRFRTPVILKE